MNNISINLFESLLAFHPREHYTPKENFLTESLVYILRTNELAQKKFLSYILNIPTTDIIACKIETRRKEKHPKKNILIFPDMVVEGTLSKKKKFSIYFEHKWDAKCNATQLKNYHAVVQHAGTHATLIFIGATLEQLNTAKNALKNNECQCILWEDIYRELHNISDKSPMLEEFLLFLEGQGLSPMKPVSKNTMRGINKLEDANSKSAIQSLLGFCNRLNTSYDWKDVIPKRYHKYNYVHDAYGRVGIRFETEQWRPALTIGFYYDDKDHRVPLLNKKNKLDLFLRIEATPKFANAISPSLLNLLKEKRNILLEGGAIVSLKDDHNRWNSYSVLIIQSCLADVIGEINTVDDQLAVVHTCFANWLTILFGDKELENQLKKSGLNSV